MVRQEMEVGQLGLHGLALLPAEEEKVLEPELAQIQDQMYLESFVKALLLLLESAMIFHVEM